MAKNWKTTIAGLCLILGILGKDLAAGHVDLAADLTAFTAAIGLILAKDHNQ